MGRAGAFETSSGRSESLCPVDGREPRLLGRAADALCVEYYVIVVDVEGLRRMPVMEPDAEGVEHADDAAVFPWYRVPPDFVPLLE